MTRSLVALALIMTACEATAPLPPPAEVPLEARAVPGSFAAIAYSPSNRASGYAVNQTDRASAESAAMASCGAADCQSVVWVANIPGLNGCTAVVATDNGGQLYWSFAADHESAEAEALARCSQQTAGCAVQRWICAN